MQLGAGLEKLGVDGVGGAGVTGRARRPKRSSFEIGSS